MYPSRLARPLQLVTLATLVLAAAACVVNPVTGQRELGLVSTAQEIAIGEQQYVPAQQMQGGQYSVDPGLGEYVSQVGQRVAAASDVALPYEFVVLNNPVPNAWALPGGKIAVNRGLLTELKNEAELAAVLGHEVVHAAARHGARNIERGLLLQTALIAAAVGTRNSDYSRAIVGSAQLAAGLLTQKFGRDAEREADYYGTRYMASAGYDPYAAVTLQETFLRLSEGRNPSWIEGLFSSHPPSAERAANNRGLVRQLKEEGLAGSEFNADSYQNALRQLREDAPAYAAYDEARKAYADRDLDTALRHVERALELQNAEPSFHGLRGDVRLRQKRYRDAVTNYDRAIDRHESYFAYHLGRGLSYSALGERAAARADLERSVELLPTAVAHNELGTISEGQGDVDAALRHFQIAAEAEGEVGRAALANVLRLDLPRQPGRYVGAEVGRDAQGRLVLQVTNATAATLGAIRIQVNMRTAEGGVLRYAPVVQRLGPQSSVLLLIPDQPAEIVDASAFAVAARVVQ